MTPLGQGEVGRERNVSVLVIEYSARNIELCFPHAGDSLFSPSLAIPPDYVLKYQPWAVFFLHLRLARYSKPHLSLLVVQTFSLRGKLHPPSGKRPLKSQNENILSWSHLAGALRMGRGLTFITFGVELLPPRTPSLSPPSCKLLWLPGFGGALQGALSHGSFLGSF